jgi:hypothetical protein
MRTTENVWPKLAIYHEAEPIMFGFVQDNPSAPVQLVKPGQPPVYFGSVANLPLFCQVFGLDCPTDFVGVYETDSEEEDRQR